MNCSHVRSWQWPQSEPALLTRYKTKRTSTMIVTFSSLTGPVRRTDKVPFLHLAQLVRKTDNWLQRPVRLTDWENSSGLYIARSSIPCLSLLTTERVSRVHLPLPPLTKELERWHHELCQTTKVPGGNSSTGLGKASMPQKTHPSLCFLGG
eukprot:4617440-Amphidinium_carterae.1